MGVKSNWTQFLRNTFMNMMYLMIMDIVGTQQIIMLGVTAVDWKWVMTYSYIDPSSPPPGVKISILICIQGKKVICCYATFIMFITKAEIYMTSIPNKC